MYVDKGYHLGQLQSKFILWNEKEIIYLPGTKLSEAEKEAKQILKQKQ